MHHSNSPSRFSAFGRAARFDKTALPAVFAFGLLAASSAHSQVTLKPDGEWRSLFTAGANASTGNTSQLSVNLAGEGVRLTNWDKISVKGQIAYARSQGVQTTERGLLGGQYNRDLNPLWFGFGSGDFVRDEPANISSRYSVAGGIGRHMIKRDDLTFDLSAGLGYTRDEYVNAANVAGAFRDEYGRPELVLAEESSHRLTQTTSFRQKFTLLPNLRDSGEYRANLDTSVSVAMTKSLNLTAGFNYRFDSDPGIGLKKTDMQLVTGVSVRFD